MRIIRPVKVTKTGGFSRASTGTYWNKSGLLQTASANELRITYDLNDLTKAPYALVETEATNRVTGSATLTSGWAGASVTDAGAFYGGIPYQRITKVLSGANENRANNFGAVTAGQKQVLRLVMRAGSVSGASLGLYDTSGTAWGVAGDASCRILSGPGAISQINGALCSLSGLSTTADTLIEIVRTYAAPGAGAVILYPEAANSTTLGASILATRVQVEDNVGTSYIPTTTTPVTRAADVITGTGLIYSSVPENDYPVWNSAKVYTTGERVIDTTVHKVYESVVGVTCYAGFATANNVTLTRTTTGAIYVPAVGTPIVFTGTLPAGITPGATYYVMAVTGNTFTVQTGGTQVTFPTSGATASAVSSTNLNAPVSSTTNWLDVGYDNRWEMFDDSVTSQTTQAGDITVVFSPGARLDAIAGLNMAANSMKVALTDLTTGVVTYSAKANLISNSGVQDFYRYLYEPIIQMPDCLMDGIPLGLSTNSAITVTFQSNGTTKVGGVVFGLSKDIGVTEWGAKVGIVDYSVKTKDAFGNYNITPRAFSKKGDFTVQVPTGQVDALQNILAQYRSTPIVYIGSNTGKDRMQFNSTIIYGFYKDFDINISYNAYSVCSLSIEGLT